MVCHRCICAVWCFVPPSQMNCISLFAFSTKINSPDRIIFIYFFLIFLYYKTITVFDYIFWCNFPWDVYFFPAAVAAVVDCRARFICYLFWYVIAYFAQLKTNHNDILFILKSYDDAKTIAQLTYRKFVGAVGQTNTHAYFVYAPHRNWYSGRRRTGNMIELRVLLLIHLWKQFV